MDPLVERVPEKAWLPLAYLGPVAWYSKYFLHPCIFIECYDHYNKQSYRNRCLIYSANGPLSMSIPVLTGSSHKILVKDIRIDNSRAWRRLHMKGIESSYRSAPFYEYYIDSLLPCYHKKYSFLLDLNIGLHSVLLKQLNINATITLTDNYVTDAGEQSVDYRESLHPKKSHTEDPYFISVPYRQVFMERFGFIPNLSIIDLLFNMGAEATEVLRRSISPTVTE
jgi:hypothetical protein